MFTGEMAESRQEEVTIRDVEESALETLVDFCYTSHIVVEESNVQTLLPAACLLQLQEIQGRGGLQWKKTWTIRRAFLVFILRLRLALVELSCFILVTICVECLSATFIVYIATSSGIRRARGALMKHSLVKHLFRRMFVRHI